MDIVTVWVGDLISTLQVQRRHLPRTLARIRMLQKSSVLKGVKLLAMRHLFCMSNLAGRTSSKDVSSVRHLFVSFSCLLVGYSISRTNFMIYDSIISYTKVEHSFTIISRNNTEQNCMVVYYLSTNFISSVRLCIVSTIFHGRSFSTKDNYPYVYTFRVITSVYPSSDMDLPITRNITNLTITKTEVKEGVVKKETEAVTTLDPTTSRPKGVPVMAMKVTDLTT